MEDRHFAEQEIEGRRVRLGGRARRLAAIIVLVLLGEPTARALADETSQQEQTPRPSSESAIVAQRAMLTEWEPNTQERKQYVGSVIWKMENAPRTPLPADAAIRGVVEIPERDLLIGFTMRRNLDPSSPMSHEIEIEFGTPADFPPGGIADVPRVLLGDIDQSRGAPLAGSRVKVSAGFFLIGLSSHEADVKHNMRLLNDRPSLHILIVYDNGQRALLAVEKGVAGGGVFDQALRVWGQTPAATR